MKTSGIYRIDLGNGWFYIGSAVNLKQRENRHRSGLKCKNHDNGKMQNVWNKYGIFKFTILEQCRKNELLNREQFYLDQYFNDAKNVNINPTAGSMVGYTHTAKTLVKLSAASKGRIPSADTRAKMSAAGKGKSKSMEHRAKISIANKGKIFSIEHRANLSNACRNKKLSMEHRAKISEANKGRKHTEKTKTKISEANKTYQAYKRVTQMNQNITNK